MTTPSRYRKKPVEIEAMQWEGGPEAASSIIDWVQSNAGGDVFWHAQRNTDTSVREATGEEVVFPRTHPVPEYLAIPTLEGIMKASVKDYIIKGIHGEFYPCKPDIFEQSYELVPTFMQGQADGDGNVAAILMSEHVSDSPGDIS